MSYPTKTPRWFLAPFYSRGEFSPRLLMAWHTLYFMFWVIARWLLLRAAVVAGVLIQPQNIVEVVGILAGLIASLLALGTFQKVRLDGPPPVPETDNSTTIKADTAPVSADTVTINQP